MTDHTAVTQDIIKLINQCPEQDQRIIFDYLRRIFPIHELESRLNTSAEVILEAISRASDLTLRGIRGIIAEAAFKQDVVLPLVRAGHWSEITLVGDHPFDFAISDSVGRINIQVKMQRQKEQRPMLASEASKRLFASLDNHFVVETQRTRGGQDKNGEATRPYKYGEFDILAVSLHPSSGNWSDFIYTVERWLISTPDKQGEIFKYQPVPMQPNEFWTNNLNIAVEWFRSGINKHIGTGNT